MVKTMAAFITRKSIYLDKCECKLLHAMWCCWLLSTQNLPWLQHKWTVLQTVFEMHILTVVSIFWMKKYEQLFGSQSNLFKKTVKQMLSLQSSGSYYVSLTNYKVYQFSESGPKLSLTLSIIKEYSKGCACGHLITVCASSFLAVK